MKLTKFPVTAPDGAEYRVTIREVESDMFTDYVTVKLQERRKRFGYRTIFQRDYYDGHGVYSATDPDLIGIATRVVIGYTAMMEENLRRSEARRAFTEWDGRITLNEEVTQ
ncbi:hypothetical protein PASE110613_09435 [Paenibacillus sediminis]|uniref:Phage protein n=1 Tax=Paenibacillus sediminis TaxID=664909 RepID=A0ABS4H6G7_9BACL|nr:hypothetical protein [Paenibacillus sediminis]MBP1938129.1 hypothetical protein [Paenibacillus sediminis]